MLRVGLMLCDGQWQRREVQRDFGMIGEALKIWLREYTRMVGPWGPLFFS